MIFCQNNYWEKRYSIGGSSGKGSIGRERAWKWSIIDNYCPNIQNVIDVGCGDLSFWSNRECKDYTGIDMSKTIIEKNKTSHPKWEFICTSSDKFIKNLKNKHVFCFDLLFHIMDNDVFVKTLKNICHYSSLYIFIHTWKSNPFSRTGSLKRFFRNRSLISLKYILFPRITDKKYQYFRSLPDYFHIFKKRGFKLLNEHQNPNSEGCIYVFKKLE